MEFDSDLGAETLNIDREILADSRPPLLTGFDGTGS